MKKLLALFLAMTLLFSMGLPFAGAFSDIKDPDQSFAAETLQTLNIINGKTATTFAPDAYLTRAEFCKIATLALGFDEINTYSNVTVFRDVPHTHWAAPYINAAVRKYKIIQGFPDGSFQPDATLTYGQAVTILVNMLGYTVEDVGAFWPLNYIEKAGELKLSEGVSCAANDPVPRGEAAILVRNMLLASTKEGPIFLEQNFVVTKDATLLKTDASDFSLAKNAAVFSVSGSEIEKTMENQIPSTLIGTRGYIVSSPKNTSRAIGFVPDVQNARIVTANASYADRLETDEGPIYIGAQTETIVNGSINTYSNSWFDIMSGASVRIFYDEDGQIDFLSVGGALSGANTYIYGLTTSANLREGSKIIKNGAEATPDDVKQYDAITYNSSEGVFYVSDRKLKGILESAEGTYSRPTSIRVLGRDIPVPEYAAGYFENIKNGQEIVLIFDYMGNLAAALPSSEISFEQVGIFTELNGSEATISLLSGMQIKCETNLEGQGFMLFAGEKTPRVSSHVGKLVRVTENKPGVVTIIPVSYSKTDGTWDVEGYTLGNRQVSKKVRVFEQVGTDAPLNEISIDAISSDTVSPSNILYTGYDSSGKITYIILGDVTGESYDYGILTGDSVDVESTFDGVTSSWEKLTLILTQADGTRKEYYTPSLRDVYGVPGAVPKGMENCKGYSSLPYKVLSKTATVKLSDFDGNQGVRTPLLYIPIAENVQVYSSAQNRFLSSLNEAKANFETFELYCDKAPSEGGKVRIIIVK